MEKPQKRVRNADLTREFNVLAGVPAQPVASAGATETK
jgi:hypothetical protein